MEPKTLVLRRSGQFSTFTRRFRVTDWLDAERQLVYWMPWGFTSYSVEYG